MTTDRRLRVLHLGSPTGLYGAERWILALINNIDSQYIESEVAVVLDDPAHDAPLCREAEAMGFVSTVFEAHGKFNWTAVRQVREHIRRRHIDVLHTHGYKSDLIALLAARGTGCRIVSTPHGWSTDADFKLKVYESLDRLLFYGFDAVAPLSRDLYGGLAKWPGLAPRLHLITNGVDLRDIDRHQEVSDDLLTWKQDGELLLGFIGQLISRKGLDLLLYALSEWRGSPWRLAIVGEGEDRPKLERLAADLDLAQRIRFLGFRPDRLSLLRAFDVFVLPSRLEGVPRCLMEAMACEVPIVASDIPGCRDLIAAGSTGLLFAPDDVSSLKRALDAVTSDSVSRRTLAVNARQQVESFWSAQSMASRYLDLYRELAHG